jgi:peptidoglycan/LPS O-acetylase OafA/YrhL
VVRRGCCTLLIVDAARLNASRIPVVFSKLGDWSYAIYLVHVPCFLLVYKLWPSSGGTATAWLGALGVALLAGAVFGSFDVRLYRHLKGTVDRVPETRRRRLISFYITIFSSAIVIGLFYH